MGERCAETRIVTLLFLICVGACAYAVEGGFESAVSRLGPPIVSHTFEAAAMWRGGVEAASIGPAREAVRVFLLASVVYLLLVFFRCRN